jgi:hypothetical protein
MFLSFLCLICSLRWISSSVPRLPFLHRRSEIQLQSIFSLCYSLLRLRFEYYMIGPSCHSGTGQFMLEDNNCRREVPPHCNCHAWYSPFSSFYDRNLLFPRFSMKRFSPGPFLFQGHRFNRASSTLRPHEPLQCQFFSQMRLQFHLEGVILLIKQVGGSTDW